jgi:hypothetical protein
MRKLLSSLGLGLLGATVFSLAASHSHLAYATQAKPPTSWSWYVSTTNATTAFQLGWNQGNYDKSTGQSSQVVLDFCGQQAYAPNGTILCTNPAIYVSEGQIESVADNFAAGYWQGTGNDNYTVLTLDIGTNNSAWSVTYGGGQEWSAVVNAIRSYVSTSGISTQVAIRGANDIEVSWDSFANTQQWVRGFEAAYGLDYVDFGAAEGCPEYSSNNGGCNNGWNQYDVWWVAWGTVPAFVIPEIYVYGNVLQWYQISRYGSAYRGYRIYFEGPMDEHDLAPSEYDSPGAWNDLWNQLNSDSLTVSNLIYSVQIHRE